MLGYQDIPKFKKTQFEETEQASEPAMAGMLEIPDKEFKISVIYVLRALMDKVDTMQKHMDNGSRERKILGKKQK